MSFMDVIFTGAFILGLGAMLMLAMELLVWIAAAVCVAYLWVIDLLKRKP